MKSIDTMKFLENDRLAQLTAQLTEAKICERVINGRIEAFTMKRAGTDKKFAHALGEKYQHEIDAEETEFSNLQRRSFQSQRNGNVGAGNSGNSCGVAPFVSTTKTSPRNKASKGGSPPLPPKFMQNQTISAIRKSTAPPSPKQKRVKYDLKPGGRRRSSSTSAIPSFLGNTPKVPISSIRSRSDSFDKVAAGGSFTNFPYSNSPLGDFHNTSTQRLMTDLILTLNASFPDYEFSNIRPSHFSRSPSSTVAINRTNERLSELAACTPQGANFLPQLWNAIDDVINLSESDVYSYVPPSRDDDDDALSFLTDSLDGTDSAMPLWSFNFFFVNKSLKRIVLFTCVQCMRTEVEEQIDDLGVHDDGEDLEYETGFKVASGKDLADFGSPLRIQRSDTGMSRTDGNTSMEEEDEGGVDYDMDPDSLNQAILPPATVA